MKPWVQVELKINPTYRFRLTLYGLTDEQTPGQTVQVLYARGIKIINTAI
jgi:hypothetical protein